MEPGKCSSIIRSRAAATVLAMYLSPRRSWIASSSRMRSIGYLVETTRRRGFPCRSTVPALFMGPDLLGSTRFLDRNRVTVRRNVDVPRSRVKKKKRAIPELLSTEQFRTRLKQAIAESRLTQVGLAERLGVRKATVTDWINSEGTANLPGGEAALRLAGILRVNFHWLWTGEGDIKALPGEADARLEAIRLIVDPEKDVPDEELRALLDRFRPPGPRAGSGGDGP